MQKSGLEINIKDRLKPLFANNVAGLEFTPQRVFDSGRGC
jgi:hypothetical protein